MTPEESVKVMDNQSLGAAVLDEVADVLIYLVRLADVLNVDLLAATEAKISRNKERFPAY